MSAEEIEQLPGPTTTSMKTAKRTPLLFIPRHIENVDIRRQVHGSSAGGVSMTGLPCGSRGSSERCTAPISRRARPRRAAGAISKARQRCCQWLSSNFPSCALPIIW